MGELVIARGIGGTVWQCERCGRADRSADRLCPSCGGTRHRMPVRVVIPELARRHGVSVEVVARRAASPLRAAGGRAPGSGGPIEAARVAEREPIGTRPRDPDGPEGRVRRTPG